MMLFLLAVSMIVAMTFAAIILMIEESASKRLDDQKSTFDPCAVLHVAPDQNVLHTHK